MSDIPPRLLRETLRNSMTPSTSGCLDADTLAAWSDGSLRARERTTVESHAASCARCQALLAAMARTAPPAAPTRWWRTSTFAWLAPLAAATAAIVVWINVPGRPLEKAAPQQAARSASTDIIPQVAQAEPAPLPTTQPPTVSTDRRPELKAAVRPNVAKAPAAATAQKPLAKAEEEQRTAPADAIRPAPRTEPSSTAQKDVRVEAAPTASNAAAAAPPAAPMAFARAAEDQATSRLRAPAAAKLLSAPIEILAPNGSTRWRILAAGNVARSVDGGSTWQTQSTGVSTALTAGSAPDSTTCWLVGLGGVIVVSTDDRSWQRVPFPEALDLTAIRATSRTNATVTSADGRTFTTTDGGTTWR
jgi:hypothetical protein